MMKFYEILLVNSKTNHATKNKVLKYTFEEAAAEAYDMRTRLWDTTKEEHRIVSICEVLF